MKQEQKKTPHTASVQLRSTREISAPRLGDDGRTPGASSTRSRGSWTRSKGELDILPAFVASEAHAVFVRERFPGRGQKRVPVPRGEVSVAPAAVSSVRELFMRLSLLRH